MRSLFDILNPVAELLDSILLVEIGVGFVHVVVEICEDFRDLSIRFSSSADWARCCSKYSDISKACTLDECHKLLTK